jgi:type II secretion system protein N
MNLRTVCTILGLSIGGVLLFLILTALFIPGTVIISAANSGLSKYGLTLDVADFGKALPLGIKGKGLTLSSSDGELLKIDKGRLAFELLPLFLGRVSVVIDAEIGSGTMTAALSLMRAPSARIEVKKVRLEDIPFFRTAAGMKASGILSGKAETTARIARSKGYLQLDVQGVDLSGIKIGDMPLPDAAYRTVQGMIRIKDGKGSIESFTLQGDDLYVRLKGGLPLADPIAATPLDLSLELMPKPALLEKQKLIFLLLLKFQDTPGHYLIPVRGTLGKPKVL